MKTYIGMPLPAGADPKKDVPVVTVVDGDTGASTQLHPLPGGNFSWGKGGIYHGNLARAILSDFLGDDPLVIKIYQRFAARRVLTLSAGLPFQMLGRDVAAAITAIVENEEGMDAIRAKIAHEPAPMVSDAMPGRDAEGKPMVIEEKG